MFCFTFFNFFRERIAVDDWGFAIFAVLPLAFVNVRFDQFRQISLWQQMRILCAGIWHNIILSFVALILLSFKLYIFSPFFHVGKGVTVFQIHQVRTLMFLLVSFKIYDLDT